MTRTAVVTGGTRGIGLAISKALKAAGMRVAALYVSNDEEAARCRDALGLAVIKCDVGDYAQCQAAIGQAEQIHGPVDILVNNAGVTRDFSLRKMTPDQWNQVIRVDLTGVFNMTRQVFEGMCGRGFGRIINISSINGQKGQFGQANYCAAKAGVIGFTKALAFEGARRGVTVNAVAPGYTETTMIAAVPEATLKAIEAEIPLGRLCQPDEVARCVAFLAGDEAAYITGATVAINGGQYMMG